MATVVGTGVSRPTSSAVGPLAGAESTMTTPNTAPGIAAE